MFIGGFFLLGAMFAFLLVPLVLLILALVDLVQRSDAEWSESGQDRLTWLLITLLVALVGPVLYLVIARPRLDEAKFGLEAGARTKQPPPPSLG